MQRAQPLSAASRVHRTRIRPDALVCVSLSFSARLSVFLALSLYFSLARRVGRACAPVGGRMLPVASRCPRGWPTGKEKNRNTKYSRRGSRRMLFLILVFLPFLLSPSSLFSLHRPGNVLRATLPASRPRVRQRVAGCTAIFILSLFSHARSASRGCSGLSGAGVVVLRTLIESRAY